MPKKKKWMRILRTHIPITFFLLQQDADFAHTCLLH